MKQLSAEFEMFYTNLHVAFMEKTDDSMIPSYTLHVRNVVIQLVIYVFQRGYQCGNYVVANNESRTS